MKKLLPFVISLSLVFLCISLVSAKIGKSCTGDASCDFGEVCKSGVCIKKKQFDFGSSGKTGKPCQIDADCIGSGSCVKNNFGKKVCSGN